MNHQTFIDNLRAAADPDRYPEVVSETGPVFDLLMHRPGPLLFRGRYALAVAMWDPALLAKDQIRIARRTATDLLDATGTFWRAGLYLVFLAEQNAWPKESLPADRTGFHEVIIQAIHFIDISSGKDRLEQSAWGSVKFGKTDSVSETIKSILKKGANNQIQCPFLSASK